MQAARHDVVGQLKTCLAAVVERSSEEAGIGPGLANRLRVPQTEIPVADRRNGLARYSEVVSHPCFDRGAYNPW